MTSSSEETSSELVALIREGDGDIRRADSKVKVVSICKNKCELFALFDTGSPVSFIKYDLYLNLIRSRVENLQGDLQRCPPPICTNFIYLVGGPSRYIVVQ